LKRILVVEDEQTSASFIEQGLRAESTPSPSPTTVSAARPPR
jgi:DNA-binding response OmpR family regulator